MVYSGGVSKILKVSVVWKLQIASEELAFLSAAAALLGPAGLVLETGEAARASSWGLLIVLTWRFLNQTDLGLNPSTQPLTNSCDLGLVTLCS